MLYLLHHADAVDALIDPQRPLSDDGRRHAERLAGQARDREVRLSVIWHSGKLRARQTAEPFWRLCNPLAEFAAQRGLQPGDPPEWIRGIVEGDDRDIMLVGHMPHLARLHELLAGPGTEAVAFPLHGLVALEYRDGGWVEAWRLE
jgi:phosphohistidine phosphatase